MDVQAPPAEVADGKEVPIMVEDVNDALEKSGGVSTFQYISFAIISSCFFAGIFFGQSLAYFIKMPPLLCQTDLDGPFSECEVEVACNTELTKHFNADSDSIYTLDNWVQQLDLYCKSEF